MLARTALLVSVALLVARAALAAEEQAAPAQGTPAAEEVPVPEGRVLNGHVFMPSATVAGALTTTSFASFMVLGLGTTSGSFQVADRTYSGSFDYAGTGAVLGYEYAFLRYFSARFTLADIIYS